MKIDTNKLPDKSDSVATKNEAEAAIKSYGSPSCIELKYKTTVIVSFNGFKWLRIPYEAIKF